MSRDSQLENYLEEMEKIRKKMIATALVHGLDHPKVLVYSQKIDEKHNLILEKEKSKKV
jgi:hypothetical protein